MSSNGVTSPPNGKTTPQPQREAVGVNSTPLSVKSLEDASKDDLIKQIKKQRVFLQKIKNKCDELNQTNSTLEIELKEAKQANSDTVTETYVKKNAVLQEECQNNLRKYKEAVEQIECMQSKEHSLTSAMQCLQNEIILLSTEQKALKSVERDKDKDGTEIAELHQKLESANVDLLHLRRELDIVSSKNQQLNQETEANHVEMNQIRSEKKLTDNMLLETNSVINRLSDENSSLRSECSKALSDIQELRKLLDVHEKAETDELEELRTVRVELTDKLDVAMNDIETLRGTLEETQRVQTETAAIVEASRSDEISNLRIKLDEARMEVDTLQKQNTLLQAESQNAKLEYDRLLVEEKTARTEMALKLDVMAKETAAFREAVEESQHRQKEVVETIEASQSGDLVNVLLQLEETRGELGALQNQNTLLQAELEHAMLERDQLLFEENREEQSDRSVLEEQVATLQSEIEELRGLLEGAEFESEELRAKLEEAETAEDEGGSAVKEELQTLREQLASLKCVDTKSVQFLEDQISLLKEREEKCEEILEDLCTATSIDSGETMSVLLNEDIVVKLNGVKNRICDMEADIDKLTFQLQDKNVEILELQDKYSGIDKLNEEMVQMRLYVQHKTEENEQLKNDRELIDCDFAKLKEMDLKHEEQLFEYEKEINVLGRLVEERNEEVAANLKKFQEADEVAVKMVEENRNINLQLEALKFVENQMAEAQRQKCSREKEVEEVKVESVRLNNRLDEMRSELNALEMEKNVWMTERDTQNSEIERLVRLLEKSNEETVSETDSLQHLTEMETKLSEAERKNTELNAKVIELTEEIQKLELERPTLEAHKRATDTLANSEESLRLCLVRLEEAENGMIEQTNEREKVLLELASVRSQLMNLKADDDHNQAQLQALTAEKKEMETMKGGWSAKISELQVENEKLHSRVEDENKELNEMRETSRLVAVQLEKEKENHRITINQLEQLQQQAKSHNVVNLELADYERLVGELNQQVKKLQEEREELNRELKQREEMTNAIKSQLDQVDKQQKLTEERSNKMKVLLINKKKKLVEVERRELEWNDRETQLKTEMELCRQKAEDFQVEISNLLGLNQKLHETIATTKDSHQRIVRSLDVRITSLQSDLNTVRQEYTSCQSDFENYKIRVHSVLKQQKSKSPTSTLKDEVVEICERECLEKVIDQLKLKLQESADESMALKTENGALQEDNERHMQKYNKLSELLAKQENDWKERFEALSSDENIRHEEHLETVRQLQRQNEVVVSTYKEQLQSIREEHERTVRDLRLQLSAAETELWRCQRDVVKPALAKDEVDIFDVANTERQEGEGSENTEPASGTPIQYQPDMLLSSDISLEQLLSPHQKASTISSSVSQHELETLEQQVLSSVKKMEHVTELLNESEASNMRLSEQTRILKEEIRRLERNQEREEHTANMEYLKNVVVKFLTLSSGDERERLVPVLTMMLQLSPEERSQLNLIASKGHPQSSGDGDNNQVTWGSYLPRWSGLV